MSTVRVLALLVLGLLLLAMASGTVRNSYAFALLTGQCLHRPAPVACQAQPPPIPTGKDI